MKPTNADTAWCKQHADWLAELLEKRGGWRVTDWFFDDELNQAFYVGHDGEHIDDPAIWLPTTDDALLMLEQEDVKMVVVFTGEISGGYFAARHGPRQPSYYGATRRIALLELLYEVTGE
jgi:hypothetical protein